MPKRTILFIHGSWIHASSWQPWMDFFNQHGYETLSPGWPGDSATVAESRANLQAIANRGVAEVADSCAKIIASLAEPSIVIGHSFGGLIAQNRGHSLIADHGWREVAEYSLAWLNKNSF